MSSTAASGIGSNHSSDKDYKRDELLEGLASLPYYERLAHFLRGSTRHWVTGGVTVVDFRPLYTVTIHHLQRQLAEEIRRIGEESFTDQKLECLRDIIHRYTDALRDFEFIHANRWNTYFIKDIAASRLDNGPGSRLQAELISELNLKVSDLHRSLFQDSDLLGSFNPKLMQHSTAIGGSLGTGREQTVAGEERQAQFRMASTRFAFAIVGGLIIVVPILILDVGNTTAKTLAVITMSIFLFALSVAMFSKAEAERILAVTAAYAAVLMALIPSSSNIEGGQHI